MAVVLVIDDDALMRQVMDATLRRAGHKVLMANDGDAGLALARGCKPDAILLDVMMPGMHGFEVCRQLKSDQATGAIPVVIVSARADTTDRERGLAAGADAYISKPFSPRELTALLAERLAVGV